WLKEYLSTSITESQIIQPLSMTQQLSIADDYDSFGGHMDDEYRSLHTQLTKEEFLLLLSLFPNLKNLDLEKCQHSFHYMKILGDCELENMPLLEKISMDSYVDDEYDEESRMLRLAVYNNFRQSIKSLDVLCIDARETNFIKSLANFTSLRTIYLYNGSDPDLTIFSLFQACPNLSDLSYNTKFATPAKAAQQLIDIIHKMKGRPISHFFKYLKVMRLYIPALTTPYIDFITNHIPKSLNEIEIYQRKVSLYDWIDFTTMNTALNLCKSLQKLKAVRLTFVNNGVMNSEKIDLFHHILNELIGKREFHNRSTLHKARVDFDDVGVDIRIAGSNLSYKYYVGNEDDQSCNIATPSDLIQLSKADTFKVWTFINAYHSLPKNYLDYVKKHCPLLTQFHIYGYRKDCFLKAECLGLSKPSTDNMTHITLDRLRYSQKLMDDLLDYFPKIEVVNVSVEGSHAETTEIRINLFKFKYLRTFIINLQGMVGSPPASFFLQYIDSERQKYYSLEEYVGWRYDDKNENKFRLISADDMQKGLEDKNMKKKYAIYVEGHQHLARTN
ncbi:unnamed protein product, partial [Mucor hiemalis]